MSIAIAVLAAFALFYYLRKGRKKDAPSSYDSTPAFERFMREALEQELCEVAVGFKNASEAERKRLAQTLANEPDADVVARIEDKVKSVEIEVVKYSHETDAEATVRVRYEDGKVGSSTKRMPLSDLPDSVRNDFQTKGSTRVFRTWDFPWQRVSAL